MFDGNFRNSFDKSVAPIAKVLKKASISPDVLTLLGVVMAGGAAVAMGYGKFIIAFLLLVLTGLADALDGAVAKASNKSSVRGAFFDSVSDRLSDGFLFAGLGWYFTTQSEPRLAMLPFALYVAASLVSYQRAKAESLGFDAKGGLMERAERFIVLGAGLIFSTYLVYVLSVMLVLTVITALMRFNKVWIQASKEKQDDSELDADDLSKTSEQNLTSSSSQFDKNSNKEN